MAAKGIPAGFHTLTAGISVERAAEAIEFLKKAFGAKEIDRAIDPSGRKVWHADLVIGDSHLFVSDTFPEMGAGTPRTASLWMYVSDVDAAWKRAVDAGCKVTMPLADMFWGDRTGRLEDPWGNHWSLAQRVKDMTPEEMQRASEEAAKQWNASKK